MSNSEQRRRVLILGAAGRDFHNFNVVYRSDSSREVVAFTATQIPGISKRRYPAELAGPLYPDGVRIEEESNLESLCREHGVDEVAFAYSDVPHEHVMHLASRALSVGADFVLHGPRSTMIESRRPVIAVSAMRTGCGKSQTSRWLSRRLASLDVSVAAIRHPMPYGDLATQAVQRFASLDDLDVARCTAEEREEYEPHIAAGTVIFAGVDYERILERAEQEAQLVIWDGGNNDFPFIRPDLHIAITDALRPGQVATHHPGESVVRMADVVVVNKVRAAPAEDVERLVSSIRLANPSASIVRAASPITLDEPSQIAGRRVLVVEDGPTITHGGMEYGAGFVAASEAGAAEIVDPRGSAAPAISEVYECYPHIGRVLPAMGYGDEQLDALRRTIDGSDADVVVSGTPIDLGALLRLDKPVVRARYDYEEMDDPGLGGIVDQFLSERSLA